LRLSAEIAAAANEDQVCEAIVQGLRDPHIGYSFVGLFLVDPATGDRVMRAAVGWTGLPTGWRVPKGQGLSATVLETGRIQYTPDVTKEPRYIPGLTTGSEVDVPLLIDGAPGGVLVVESDRPQAFGDEDFAILTAAAHQASIAITRARLLAQQQELLAAERRRADEQQALVASLADLSSELELSKLLEAVLARAVHLLGAAGGELATFDAAAGELEIVANQNTGRVSIGTRLKVGEGAMGQVAGTLEPLIISDYRNWAGRSSRYADVEAHAAVVLPLLIGRRLVGAINFWHTDRGRSFSEADLRLAALFTPQAAVAIENARLFTAAERQRRYFEELVRNNPVAIVNIDAAGRVVSCNPAFERLYGWTEAEIAGQLLDDLVTDDTTRSEAKAYTSEASDHAVKGIGRRRRRDGTLVDVEVLAVPVVIDGERVGMMGLYHDISELLATRREAEAANAAKSQFLASMSHELRTPLNAIIGYSEMLQEDAREDGDTGLVSDLAKIHGAGRHLLTLINDVLDLSKIEAGKMELYLETFEVRPVLETVATTIVPMIERNGNTLVVDAGGPLGAMHGDLTRVRQILLNLLSNASKFTERGTITLSARRVGSELVFAVRDTGIGMTPEQLGRLFEAFAQAEAATSAKYGGTGLGLAISRKFCEMMGGSIGVESTPGAGTTFTVRLPVAVATEAAEQPDLDAAAGVAGTVLIIDDDPAVRDLLARTLAKDGYRVLLAESGETGLRMARERRPDVITLDVLMPGMDGWEVLAALQADPALSETPVVMLTILDEPALGFALGASDYLTKPLDRDRLLRALRQLASSDLTPDDRRRLTGDVTRVIRKGAIAPDAVLEDVRALVASHAPRGSA